MDRTPWNPEWSAAIAKVTSLVESLFACRVQFQTLENFLDQTSEGPQSTYLEQDLVFLESTLFEPPPMIRGTRPGTFAFPLRVRRTGAPRSDVSLVGIAAIEGLAACDDQRLQQLGEFLQMATEARLDAFERLLDVEQNEKSLLEQATVCENTKVLQLFPRAKPATAVDTHDSFRLPEYADELMLSKPLLLVGGTTSMANGFPFNRVALELFNRTALWFFVNIADLSEDAFQSAHSFRSLGRMCIFVPDLAAVSIEKQIRLAEVFSEENAGLESSVDTPRLIASIHDTPALLMEKGTLLPHLHSLMTTFELEPTEMSDTVSSRTLRSIVKKIEAALTSPGGPGPGEKKTSNLIQFNPTFH